jgi:hypothetical protein
VNGPEYIKEEVESLKKADRWAARRGLRRIESDKHARLWVTTHRSTWLQAYLDPAHPARYWDNKICAHIKSKDKLVIIRWWWIPGVKEL